MRLRGWAVCALATGGIVTAIATSPKTHNSPVFYPGIAPVPTVRYSGGTDPAPQHQLGVNCKHHHKEKKPC